MSANLIKPESGDDPLSKLWDLPNAHPYTRFPVLAIVNPKTQRARAVQIAKELGALEDGAIYGVDPVKECLLPAEGFPVFVLGRFRFFAIERAVEGANNQKKRLESVTEERESKEQKEFSIVALLHVTDKGFYCTVSKLTGAQSRFAYDLEKEQVRMSSPLGIKRLREACPAACDPGFPPKLRVMATLRGDCSQDWIVVEADKISPISKSVMAALLADTKALTDAMREAVSVFEERCAFFRSFAPKPQGLAALGSPKLPAKASDVTLEEDDEIPF